MFKIKISHVLYIFLYSIPNTLLSFGIVYIINNAMSGNGYFLKDYMPLVFFSIVFYTYLLNIIFQRKLNEFTFKMLCEYEKSIFNKILAIPLIKLEKMGSQRFFTAIEDTRMLYSIPALISLAINSLLMLILCVVYLFSISFYSALIVITAIVVVATTYYLVINTMSQKVAMVRKLHEIYYGFVNDVIKGFKELKISSSRRQNLMNNHLSKNRETSSQLDSKISFVFSAISLISQYGLHFVIGIILFLLPEIGFLERENVISYVVIILFIAGPVNSLINLQDMITRCIVANNRLKHFLEDFKNHDENILINDHNLDFENLNFNDVYFEYDNEKSEKNFCLGPINFEVTKGETIFIIGGNGSGKSTFINLFTGLYKPLSGEIKINNSNLHSSEELQNLISAVFTDNHILSNNYDNYILKNNKEYVDLLKTMALDKIVIDDEEESARRSFSKGQSKRMSLIFALLENKPILVLDEWAADQDPYFRKYFYENLLPSLKKQGKTIIAVTHDDAYFKHADRLVKFDYGQIIKDSDVTSINDFESLWH